MAEIANRVCANCSAQVPEGHHYCGQCGARHDGSGADAGRQTLLFGPMMAPGRAKLILIRGSEDAFPGASWHLNATNHQAGRRQGVVLFPDDDYLSPKHCNFFYHDNRLHLRDEGSLNGSFVRVRRPVELSHGDRFLVGQQLIAFETLDGSEEFPMRDGTLMYVSPPRPLRFRLVQILDGGRQGAVYASPNNEVILGREGCDMNFADDRNVSRRHAKVAMDGDRFILEDLSSANGTFLNVQGERELDDGDYVFLGQQLLRVEITR